MTTATKPRKPARSRVFGLPRLLNRLPISDRAIKKIQAANDMHLLRFYFGTADNADVEALYTHLIISWGLAGRMHDAEGIREELWKGIELINRSFRAKTPREMDPQILVAVQDIVRSSLDLWRQTTVDELDHTIDEINREFNAFRKRHK